MMTSDYSSTTYLRGKHWLVSALQTWIWILIIFQQRSEASKKSEILMTAAWKWRICISGKNLDKWIHDVPYWLMCSLRMCKCIYSHLKLFHFFNWRGATKAYTADRSEVLNNRLTVPWWWWCGRSHAAIKKTGTGRHVVYFWRSPVQVLLKKSSGVHFLILRMIFLLLTTMFPVYTIKS